MRRKTRRASGWIPHNTVKVRKKWSKIGGTRVAQWVRWLVMDDRRVAPRSWKCQGFLCSSERATGASGLTQYRIPCLARPPSLAAKPSLREAGQSPSFIAEVKKWCIYNYTTARYFMSCWGTTLLYLTYQN